MSNVAKLKRQAAEFEAKKQFDKALAVYIKLLESLDSDANESDIALFNRVGDMVLRLGNVADALDYYEKAVDRYAAGRYFNNAIALCNKILRHSTGRTSVYYKLGKIHAQKGFPNDAKKHFLEYADRMQKEGRIDEAFRALKEFADLCPDQDDIRLRLAEQLARQDRRDEAIEQLQTLYEKYDSEGRSSEAAATAERMKAIDPSVSPRSGNGRLQRASGDLIFIDLDETPRATRVSLTPERAVVPAFSEMPRFEPEAEPIVSSTSAEMPESEAATHVSSFEVLWTPDPTDTSEEERGATDSSAESLAYTPPGLDGLTLLDLEPTSLNETVAYTPLTPVAEDLLVHELDEIEDVQLLVEVEASHEVQVPHEFDALDDAGAVDIGDVSVDQLASADAMDVIDVTISEVMLADALEVPDTPEDEFAPADEFAVSFGATDYVTLVDAGDEIDVLQGIAEVPTDPEPGAQAESSEPSLSRQTLVALRVVDELKSSVEQEPGNWKLRRQLAESMLEAGERAEGIHELEEAMVGAERAGDLQLASSIADDIARLEPETVRHHQKRVEYAFLTNDRSRLIDAYLALGDSLLHAAQADKARTVYNRVLDLAPDDQRAHAALDTISAVEEVERARHAVLDYADDVGYHTGEPIRGASREASPRGANPGPLAGTTAASNSFVNLGDWLREDEGPRDTRMVVEEEEPTGDEDADFADMLRKFKAGIAANVDAEDYQSHYDLAIAFKEMGLLDEAIHEFQKALGAPGSRLRTYEALGQCFIEKGQFKLASSILSRALGERATEEQLIGVLYLLGRASEAQSHGGEALGYYQRVFVLDIQFRDVADRIAALEKAAP